MACFVWMHRLIELHRGAIFGWRSVTTVAIELLQILDALLAGDGLLRALASACIGTRALAADRQTAAMTNAAIAADISQPRDVLRHLATQLPLDNVILVQQGRDPRDFVFAQLAGTDMRIDARLVAQLSRDLRANPVQVLQRNDRGPILGISTPSKSRHKI